MQMIALLVSLGLGAVAGLSLGHRKRVKLASENGRLNARFDAYRLADTRTDLDVVGPVSGQNKVVKLFDQDAGGAA